MKIELSNEQYKTLLKMLFFADWLANSNSNRDTEIYHETEGLQQYIYSFAKEFGQEEWIVFVDRHQMYFPTIKMEEELEHHVEEYNNNLKNIFSNRLTI